MYRLLPLACLLLAGCPKHPEKSVEESEREARLKELMEMEDEDMEGIPEAGEEEEIPEAR